MDLDTLLDQTGAVDDPRPEILGSARERMRAAFPPVAVLVRRKRRRRLAVTGLVAAAASAALVLGPTVSFTGAPKANAEAAQLLLRTGAAAGAQPGEWQDARYWRSVSTYVRGDADPVRREIWMGHREIGVLKDPGVDDRVIGLDVAAFPTGGSSVTWDELFALPTDPDALERRLRGGINGAGPDDDSELYVIVGDLLRESPAPPALRKALWEVAAGIPGIEVVGAVTDSAGRAGVAVERGGLRYVLDASDGRLLEEQAHGWRGTYLEQGPAEVAPAPTPGWNEKPAPPPAS